MRPVSDHDKTPHSLEVVIETARLAVLERYRTLSVADMTGLRRVSQEAAQSLEATHAAISFVDSTRVWFGGAFGFDRADAPRMHSFCDAVVRTSRPIVVPDGLVDPRFFNHELVRNGPGLRSYAGAPLIDRGGYTLGTVAIYSAEPGAFAESVLPELTGLATLVCDFLAERNGRGETRRAAKAGSRIQGWLGVKTVRAKAGGTEPGGLVIVSVARRSPAEAAGLRPTDVLHSIGGRPMVVESDIPAALAERAVGSRIEIRWRRRGRLEACDIEIVPRRR